ncbi:GD18913 [Drosophila simulans]|uniref:GD18913 n=1 Tax=Drosophila simulans TaxID=7240 RepID=B4R181_DROSI|nr:GD18913 [Drosophila simulans]
MAVQDATMSTDRCTGVWAIRPYNWDEHDEEQEQDEFEHGTGDGTGAPGAGS